MSINQKLLEILVCPKCKGNISLDHQNPGLICKACNLFYEIRDDIPIMLIEEARKINS